MLCLQSLSDGSEDVWIEGIGSMTWGILPLYLAEQYVDFPSRSINVKLSDEELAARPMQPLRRNRVVSKSLRAYAQSVSSADKGAVRLLD